MDTVEALAIGAIVVGGFYLFTRGPATPTRNLAPPDPTGANLGAALGAAGLGPWGSSAAFVLTHPATDAHAIKTTLTTPTAILGRITGTDHTPSISSALQKWVQR